LPDTLPLDTPLGAHYQLVHSLGRGAAATVYLARDLRHGRHVALKIIRPELAATVAGGRFLREMHLAARLQHPHIIPMLESGEAQGQLWYAMPYIRGESLRQLLERERALPVDVAVELARQVALALDYAHREAVIHRDLKPENILLSDGQALIVDFGLAKALEAGERLTANGVAVGTAAYISPEQASSGEVDGRSDLYSLGCLLYEMLSGQPAFTGATAHRIIAQRFTMPPPSVRRLCPEVPDWLDQVIRRMLALEPADRFPNGVEVARALVPPLAAGEQSLVPVHRGNDGTWWAARWVVPLVVAVIAGLVGRGWLAR
jgi:serine/threonine-protein kinase